MAKFMLVKFRLMAEITDADALRDAAAEREGITWWPEARDAELARQHREGIT